MHTKFYSENSKCRIGDLNVEGGTILKRILRETGYEGMDWIHKPRGMSQTRALVSTCGFHKSRNFFIS
jgi:hypothetical protein